MGFPLNLLVLPESWRGFLQAWMPSISQWEVGVLRPIGWKRFPGMGLTVAGIPLLVSPGHSVCLGWGRELWVHGDNSTTQLGHLLWWDTVAVAARHTAVSQWKGVSLRPSREEVHIPWLLIDGRAPADLPCWWCQGSSCLFQGRKGPACAAFCSRLEVRKCQVWWALLLAGVTWYTLPLCGSPSLQVPNHLACFLPHFRVPLFAFASFLGFLVVY